MEISIVLQDKYHTTEAPMTPIYQSLDRLVGRREVLLLIGISNATLWRWIKAERFPAPMKIGKKKVAWRTSVLSNWIEQRTVSA